MSLKARLKRVELRTVVSTPKVIRVLDMERLEAMTPEELAAHREDVKHVMSLPHGIVISMQDENDVNPLEMLLVGDEVLEQYRRTIRIERSYGQDNLRLA